MSDRRSKAPKVHAVSGQPFSIEVKRFYAPFIITDACPKCGNAVQKDLRDDYMSYPTTDKPFSEGMYCGDCDEEWTVRLVLSIDLRLADE